MDFAAIQALDRELRSIDADERRGLVRYLRGIDLLDREHGYAALGCGSVFDYLVRKLHLPEGTAGRRVTAMRLVRRFPVIEAALLDGRLNTTQLGVLAPHFTADNVDELARRATHLSIARTKELAVSIKPREVPADGLRKLPALAPRPATTPEPEPGAATTVAPAAVDAPEGTSSMMVLRIPEAPAVAPTAPPPLPSDRSRVEPVAVNRWQWRIRLDEARKARLDTLRGYLAHKIPDGDLEKVFDQMLADSPWPRRPEVRQHRGRGSRSTASASGTSSRRGRGSPRPRSPRRLASAPPSRSRCGAPC